MLEQSKTNLVNLFKQNSTINMDIGARVEYNMNSILENIVVSTASTDANYISQIKTVDENGNITGNANIVVNPFKKLFPVDSIVKPFRPQTGGIRYYIAADSEYSDQSVNYETLRMFEYPSNISRVYYAGDTNEYKYFVTPIGGNLDVTIKYKQTSVSIKEAYSNGQKIFFTTTSSHGFSSGLNVVVTGMGAFNVTGEISSVPETNIFTVNSTISSDKVISNGTATLSSPTKNALTNKIIATFEKFHYVPTSCSITIKKSDGTEQNLGSFTPVNGKVVLHYVKKSTDVWQQNIEDIYGINDGIEFKYADPIEIQSIKITATNSPEKIIGLIELSPRWVKDISSDIISFDIQKEASANSEDYLPIGKVSANSMSLQIVRYQDDLGAQESIQVVAYNPSDLSINKSLIYMTKGMIVKPFFKILHSNATTMPGLYDIIKQGTYYVDSWTIGPMGSTAIRAYDGAKILMDIIAPKRLYEQYSATGVIAGLLDSVGFTEYKFNLKVVESTQLNTTVYQDNSVPVINYWWSDGKKSVWDCIQEICNDIQMNAFFDENNILQISSRDYIYDNSKTKSFTFTFDQDGTTLPNITSFSNKEIPSINQVKIIYTNPYYSNLVGASTNLFVAPTSYLAAGSLLQEITETNLNEGDELAVQITQPTEFSNIQSPFAFQGYVLINSEIIEYDAVQYKLINKNKTGTQRVEYVWIESESDISKYIALAERPQYLSAKVEDQATFAPSNKLRVKKRGALGTKISTHVPTSKAFEGGKWKAYKATWK